MESWTSDSINELAQAIVLAQQELKPAMKKEENPFFRSKYADLPACWEAVHPFREHGIAIIQCPMEAPAGCIALDTVLVHTSGQWMRSRLVMPLAKLDPQGAGSAITYARRYALGCMTGLVTDEDLDGNQPLDTKRQEDGVGLASHEHGPQQAHDAPASAPNAQAAFVWRVGAKHKNESISTIPEDYLMWFAQNGKEPIHQQAAIDEIDRRRGQGALG